VKLVLTGSGPVETPPDLDGHVLDAGFLTEKGKHEALAGATVFCHPSLYESLSIVALESWLAGTPVLVHARCAVLRYQCERSRGGLWFRAYPEFEEALSLLLDRPDLCRTLADQGRAYVVKEYSWEAIEPRLLAAIEK
jgi:glycosyltransferase involved in cell wall biosynthesis